MTITAFKRDEIGDYDTMKVGEVLDYGNDLTKALLDSGDTVALSVWAVDAGLTDSSPLIAANVTSVFLTCTATGVQWVTNTITTAAGRKYIEKFRIIGE